MQNFAKRYCKQLDKFNLKQNYITNITSTNSRKKFVQEETAKHNCNKIEVNILVKLIVFKRSNTTKLQLNIISMSRTIYVVVEIFLEKLLYKLNGNK